MPLLRRYNVFISHAWNYSEDYFRVVRFLDEEPNFRWRNLSVPEHDPILDTKKLSYELHNQMRDADAFLIIAGMYASFSDWIDYEIAFARRIGRPIIGITKWGSERVPAAVERNATTVVGWNGPAIVRAIRHHALSKAA
jgi:hypothetical protein